MTKLKIIITTIIASSPQISHGELYKCTKNGNPIYQSSPCENAGDKLSIKQQTEAQSAQAIERLQQIRAEDANRAQQKQAAAEKQQEIDLKIANTIANQQNADAQYRQAKAQEIEAAKPPAIIISPYSSGIIMPRNPQ